MPEIILHQYVNSPFSEKIRKILAHKKIRWRSVEQPVIMPKPKLVPLTGGYRRIPVLQLGADIYCDTGIIIRKLDELFPEPSIYPAGLEAACHAINLWADRRFFFSTTPVIFQKLAPLVGPEFIEDRRRMMSGASFAELNSNASDALNQVRAFLDMLDRSLQRQQFVMGASFSLADAACFHPIWFLRAEPSSFALAQKHEALKRWFDQIDAMGYGDVTPMDADEALEVARTSDPQAIDAFDADDPNPLAPGARVSITPDDYGFEPITGSVVASTVYEVAIRREDPQLGAIVNHFPKVGFRINAA
jgi:glutathione S-transferase